MATNGMLGTTVDVTAAVGGFADAYDDPRIAIDPSGAAMIAWHRTQVSAGGEQDEIQARRLTPSGTLGAILDLSAAGGTTGHPEVAVASDGVATVAWSQTQDSSEGFDTTIKSRRISPSGALAGAIQDLSAPIFHEFSGQAPPPALAVAPEGVATVAWAGLAPPPPILNEPRLKVKSNKRKAKMFFDAQGELKPLTFQCKLDEEPLVECSSPKVYRRLKVGKHSASVFVRDSGGNSGEFGYRFDFRIRRR
jgi:hypothetical protein